ncbi:PaaI family thioesterase [Nocardioides pocheonensis]|jgi:acyl-coenzyme A thioesterase PaaI-like protein|uniref:Acyl-coenzyme A thioesterase THEM4 n=1 Tax=Nocardioides pocheonensis TaxID=661485 RepID=A0A3N0GRL7_9ACTN|nr:PaaI family thioesterase [Nocardioides pocheonensis]RNM14772.1 PaaI family thioesterase [Nocardioides pocheonensis]
MGAPFNYDVLDLTDEQVDAEVRVFGALTAAVRRLNEATLRTTVDHATVEEVRRQVEELTARLEKSMIPDNFGVSFTKGGRIRGYGNAVVGIRNPNAVPLTVVQDKVNGRASAEFELNALHEGPPGQVHGGVVALVLDQVFGEAAAAGGSPGMTGTLTLRYRLNTPLGPCSAEAWVDRRDGIKTIVKGELRRADGTVTVTAEGIFILPRWAREEIAKNGGTPPQFE